MAADLTLKGHDVTLFSRSPEKLMAIEARRGIGTSGMLGEQDVKVAQLTGDPDEACRMADLLALPVPGMVQDQYLRAVLPHVEPGQAIWLCPGSGGSLLASQILLELGASKSVLLIETLSLPYAARMEGPAQVGVSARIKPRCAAFPAKRNSEAQALIRELYEVPPAENVLDTALNNVNCLVHPLPCLMNFGWIEARNRLFSIYGEGMTPKVLAAIHAVDRERLAVEAAAGLTKIEIDAIYDELGTGPIYRQSMGLKTGAEKFFDRFFTEDVPVGLVMIASLGRALGVATPLVDATITLSSMLYDTDFWAQGRTAERLGLAGMSQEQMTEFLYDGARASVSV
jgi:opine dehydrogenase